MEQKRYLIHSISRISSFGNVTILKNKPLIICDIDNTILYHKKNIKENNCCDLFQKMIDCFPQPIQRDIFPIDINEFRKLEERVKKANGKIVFLSARSEKRAQTIEYDFQKIGLDVKKYEIHYTTKKYSKGKYAFNNLRRFNYGELIFIDDTYDHHLSMFEYFPEARYLLFNTLYN